MFPKVPVINLQKRKVQIVHIISCVVMTCDCGSTVPILIPNHDRAGICLTCKTKYVIAKFEVKNENGLITTSVDVAKWNGPMSASPALDVTQGH
jgi:hypothetical protein